MATSSRQKLILIVWLISWPISLLAHPNDEPVKAVVNELRAIAAQLKFSNRQLDTLSSTAPTVMQTRLTNAQAAYYANDYAATARICLELLSRRGFRDPRLRGDINELLADAYAALGFRDWAAMAASAALEDAPDIADAIALRFQRMSDLYTSEVDVRKVQNAWARYRATRPTDAKQFDFIRYLFGRTLYRGGRFKAAAQVFSGIDTSSPNYIRALYFRGIIHLREGQYKQARPLFSKAYKTWRIRHARLMPTQPVEITENDGSGERLTELKRDELSEAAKMSVELGAVLALTEARLSMHEKDWARALQFYRQVTPGTRDWTQAHREMQHALEADKAYAQAARSYQASSGASPATIQKRRLERARLLAKAGDYETARSEFGATVTELESIKTKLVSNQIQVERIALPSRSEDWKEVLVDTEALEQSVHTLADMERQLSKLTKDARLPATSQGDRLAKRLNERLAKLRRDIEAIASSASSANSANAKPVFTVDELNTSADRLEARITKYSRRLERYELDYRERLLAELRNQAPAVTKLQSALDAHVNTTETFANQLPALAQDNLDRLESTAVLGGVNIAFWKKEAITEKIANLVKQQKLELDSITPTPQDSAGMTTD